MTADCKEETQPTAEAAPVPTIKKDMKTLPIRILEEEVWFSGSELKTDNSSSDEEEGVEASVRAKRKTKIVSSAKSSQQTVMTQQRKEFSSTTTKMTMSTKVEESTSVQAMSSGKCEMVVVDQSSAAEVPWRPKRGSISLPGLSTELESIQSQ